EDKANAYFTDGVQDEILTDLAKIANLKVISRTSVLHYKSGVARNLREIAQQLGVANVVEGSVQRSGNRVRVNAQLVDARTDAHLWAQTYDRDPSFFDAYCQLAYAHEQLYAITGFDHTPARLALAEAAVQTATRLRPDAAETHLARAQYLYNGLRDYAGALAELEIARRALPNDPRVFELTGYILQRRGQQEEGLQNLQ